MNDRYRSNATLKYYRLGNYFYRHHLKKLSYALQWIGMRKTGNDISSAATIDKSVLFPHPIGIVIGSGVRIDADVIIHANVIIGRGAGKNYPVIQRGCVIYGNSCLFGGIVLKQNTIIGAGSVLLTSTEKGCVYAGVPAKNINGKAINNDTHKESKK
ncbi:MAG: hypothetical protein HDR21_03630 [Lachnospiraceae bacterium]|nr:hypothetical protein [Lachnospiraceae bacterium]